MFKKLEIREHIGEIGVFTYPVFIEQISIAGMSLVFTIIVSQISSAAVSGFSLVESLNMLVQHLFLALEIGAAVVVAQFIGRDDKKSAALASVQAMLTSVFIAVALGVILLVFSRSILGLIFGNAEKEVFESGFIYFKFAVTSFPFLSIYAITSATLRGSGNPKLSLVSVISTNVSFAVLGLVFIVWMKLGIAGAGIALLVSRIVGAAVGIALLTSSRSNLTIESWLPRKIDWEIQKSVLLIGIPSCIENIIFMTGKLLTQTFIVSMGTAAMATNAICSSIVSFYNIPGCTAAGITIPIIGKYIGMRNKKDAKESSKLIIALSIASLAVLSIIIYIISRPVVTALSPDSAIVDGIVKIVRLTLIVSPVFWSFSFVVPAVLRASGDMNYTAGVSIASMFLFRVTSGYLLGVTMGFGVIGIWIGMYIDWVMRGLLFTIRYAKGKWVDREIIKKEEIVW